MGAVFPDPQSPSPAHGRTEERQLHPGQVLSMVTYSPGEAGAGPVLASQVSLGGACGLVAGRDLHRVQTQRVYSLRFGGLRVGLTAFHSMDQMGKEAGSHKTTEEPNHPVQ